MKIKSHWNREGAGVIYFNKYLGVGQMCSFVFAFIKSNSLWVFLFQSKKISNDQELIQSDTPFPNETANNKKCLGKKAEKIRKCKKKKEICLLPFQCAISIRMSYSSQIKIVISYSCIQSCVFCAEVKYMSCLLIS